MVKRFRRNCGRCFPKHIETPKYPPLAEAARIEGKVTLTIGRDADGNITKVEPATDNPLLQNTTLLQQAAVESMKRWTFAKPPSIPFKQVIVFDYEIDHSLPADDGQNPISKVSFDLPDRVTIVGNARLAEP
jgi:TonB family protein